MPTEKDKDANVTDEEVGMINGTNTAQDPTHEANKKKVSLYKMFVFADRFDLVMMLVGTVAAIMNGMTQPVMTIIFGDVVDAFGSSTMDIVLHRVTKVILRFVYLGIASAVASFLAVACWTIAGERQAARIRALYLKAILRQDIGFFDKEMTTGQVIERMSYDTILIQDAIGEKVGKFVQLIMTFFGGFIVAFARGWLLTLVMLSTIPPVCLAVGIVYRLISTFSTRMHAAYGKAGNIAEQTISSIRTVASFNGEREAVTMYNRLIHKAYKCGVQEGTAMGFGLGTAFMFFFCSYGLAVWYGSKCIVYKGYNGGIIINVLMAVMTGTMSLGEATPCITAFAEGQAAAYRMFEAIKRIPGIDARDATGILLDDIKGDIELKNVYFSYPTRSNHLIFDGLSLRVPGGTTMALVGESGSGKSTVINLVQRFYDPEAGEVLIDGINIKSMMLGWIRKAISLVSQEPLLFATTIKENVIYGKADATMEEIKRALEVSNATRFVDKLPHGVDTMVGERGIQLSGGQKQRIAIARAIIKNPRILLLDEATSSLDLETERVVQEALNRIMLERTTIIVAHRLSNVKNVDAIAVIHQGKIVEKGKHADLIKNSDGAYSQLVHLQAIRQDKYLPRSQNDNNIFLQVGPMSSGSQNQSISSIGSSNKQSSNGCTLSNGVDFIVEETNVTNKVLRNKKKDVPVGRLFVLNNPEIPIMFGGSVAASVHGVLLPLFGILISSS